MQKGKTSAYLGLIFVIFIWGITPLVTLYFYKFFSPTIRIAIGTLVSSTALFLISFKNLKLINKDYIKLAIPTGALIAFGNIVQKIGLQYTTPTNYSFLEHLSAVVVPIALFIIFKKKPSTLTVIASVLCLLASFILSFIGNSSDAVGTLPLLGDILCALAGVFYGTNIAITGTFAKKLNIPLYLMLQNITETVISFIASGLLDITDIEKIKLPTTVLPFIFSIIATLVCSTLCWLIRTYAMKKVSPTVVGIMMPFASVVTMFSSIIVGKDKFSWGLLIGASLSLTAIILSGLGDREPKKTKGDLICN